MATLTIRLDDQLEKQLARIAKEQNRTKSERVRDLLRRYTSAKQFAAARKRLRPCAEKASYLTEEDFFRGCS